VPVAKAEPLAETTIVPVGKADSQTQTVAVGKEVAVAKLELTPLVAERTALLWMGFAAAKAAIAERTKAERTEVCIV
jgi:hypothetical protein